MRKIILSVIVLFVTILTGCSGFSGSGDMNTDEKMDTRALRGGTIRIEVVFEGSGQITLKAKDGTIYKTLSSNDFVEVLEFEELVCVADGSLQSWEFAGNTYVEKEIIVTPSSDGEKLTVHFQNSFMLTIVGDGEMIMDNETLRGDGSYVIDNESSVVYLEAVASMDYNLLSLKDQNGVDYVNRIPGYINKNQINELTATFSMFSRFLTIAESSDVKSDSYLLDVSGYEVDGSGEYPQPFTYYGGSSHEYDVWGYVQGRGLVMNVRNISVRFLKISINFDGGMSTITLSPSQEETLELFSKSYREDRFVRLEILVEYN